MKTKRNRWRSQGVLAGCLAIGALLLLGARPLQAVENSVAPNGAEVARIDFDIPAQSLDRAVLVFAAQAGLQIFFDSRKLAGLQSPGVKGRYSTEEGLASLLGGAPVSYRFRGEREVSLERRGERSGALELGSVDVRAPQEGIHGDGDWVYEAPRSVSVISRQDIDKYPPKHIAEILQDTPGVNASMNYQTPGLALNIRGIQDFGRVAMMVDGARQNYQISGHGQRNGEAFIDSELISEVVVEKGSSARAGSAGSIAGSANFRTVDVDDIVKPGEDMGLRLRGSTGIGKYRNGNDYNGSAVTAFKFDDKADLLMAYSRKRSSEFDPGRHGEYSKYTGNNYNINEVLYTRQESQSGLLKGSIRLNDAHRLRLSALHSEFEFDTAGQSVQETWYTQNKVETSTFSLTHEWRPGSDWFAVDTQLYYVDTENNQKIPDRYPGMGPSLPHGFDSRTRTETYGLTVQNNARFRMPGFDVAWNYGGELSKDKTSPKARGSEVTNTDYISGLQGVTPQGERWLGSLFSSLQFDHGDWLTLTAGLRYDRYKLEGGSGYHNPYTRTWTEPCANRPNLAGCYITGSEEFAEADNEQGRFSPNFGIAVKPFQPLQLYFNWGKGWRPPAITETLIAGNHRYVNDGTSIYPNTNLDAERSETWEVGTNLNFDNLLFEGDSFRAKVAYYNIHTENWIAMNSIRLPNGPSILPIQTFAYVNTTPVVSKGYEVDLSYDTGVVYARGSYTRNDMYSKAEYKTDYMGGHDYCSTNGCVPGLGNWFYPSPPRDVYTFQLGARAFDRRLDVGLRQRYSSGHLQLQSSEYDHSGSANRDNILKGYHVLDLYGVFQATGDLQLNLAMNNVRDRRYAIPMGDVQTQSPSPGRTVLLGFEYRL